jgi:hypothetical protein
MNITPAAAKVQTPAAAKLIEQSIPHFSDAQGFCADMLNAKSFDYGGATAAVAQVGEGIELLNRIKPGEAGYTHVDTAVSEGRAAQHALSRAVHIGTAWGGTNSPEPQQLRLADEAFSRLENALEALNNS